MKKKRPSTVTSRTPKTELAADGSVSVKMLWSPSYQTIKKKAKNRTIKNKKQGQAYLRKLMAFLSDESGDFSDEERVNLKVSKYKLITRAYFFVNFEKLNDQKSLEFPLVREEILNQSLNYTNSLSPFYWGYHS